MNIANQINFYLALSQFIASTINSISPLLDSVLEKLPRHIQASVVLYSYAIGLIVWLCRQQDKGQAPFNLWGHDIPRWLISSLICICFSALLLVQTIQPCL